MEHRLEKRPKELKAIGRKIIVSDNKQWRYTIYILGVSWGRKQTNVPEKNTQRYNRRIYSVLKDKKLQIKRENWWGATNAYILEKFLNIKYKERIPRHPGRRNLSPTREQISGTSQISPQRCAMPWYNESMSTNSER